MECIMQGIIEEQHVEALAVLLQGLCGSHREAMKVHELCLKSGSNLGQESSEVHVLCDLSEQDGQWSVRHIGRAMRGAGADQMPALVRSVLNCKTSKNKVVPITVSVMSICKLPKLHAIDEAVPISSGLQLVEITASASADNYAEVAAAVAGFAEHLAPLLHLSKPGIMTGVVPSASSASASLTSRMAKMP